MTKTKTPKPPQVAPKPPRGYEIVTMIGRKHEWRSGDKLFDGKQWVEASAFKGCFVTQFYYARRVAKRPVLKESLTTAAKPTIRKFRIVAKSETVQKVQPVTNAEVGRWRKEIAASSRRTGPACSENGIMGHADPPIMGDYEAGVKDGREQMQDAARNLVKQIRRYNWGRLTARQVAECCAKDIESALKLKG
jgi:hypothetical protein